MASVRFGNFGRYRKKIMLVKQGLIGVIIFKKRRLVAVQSKKKMLT